MRLHEPVCDHYHRYSGPHELNTTAKGTLYSLIRTHGSCCKLKVPPTLTSRRPVTDLYPPCSINKVKPKEGIKTLRISLCERSPDRI